MIGWVGFAHLVISRGNRNLNILQPSMYYGKKLAEMQFKLYHQRSKSKLFSVAKRTFVLESHRVEQTHFRTTACWCRRARLENFF